MKTLLTLGMLLVVGSAFAQEQIAVTTPITFTAPPPISAYGLVRFEATPVSPLTVHPTIIVVIVPIPNGTAGQAIQFSYPCATGTCVNDTDASVTALITTLNTNINTATRSLWRRIFDRLCLDFPSKFPNGCTVQ